MDRKIILWMIVALMASGTVYGAVCCCYPDGGGELVDMSSDCPYQIEYDIGFPPNCTTQCPAGYVPPVIDTDLTCDDPGYASPVEIELSVIVGKRGVVIDWVDPCVAEYYSVERECKKGKFRCETPSRQEIMSSIQGTSYTDLTARWDTNYTYKVTAHYTLRDDTVAEADISTGNLECWYKYDDHKFCVNENTYYKYKDYLVNDVEQFNDDDERFYSNVEAMFDRRLNRGFYCDASNMMHQIKNCNQIGGADDCDAVAGVGGECSCVVRNNNVECAARGDCTDDLADPFGLYYQQDDKYCYGEPSNSSYCFIDRSRTSVDRCYECDTRMDCYDYKTEGSCTYDNCGFGNCEWVDTLPSLGIGVCRDVDSPNCLFCSMNGTDASTNSEGYNNVFDQCSEEKASALSTSDYVCYYNDGEATFCQSTLCIDLGENACEADPCGIGVCRWYAAENKCYKDGDDDFGENQNWMDCQHIIEKYGLQARELAYDENFRLCQSDYFPPSVTFNPADIKNGLPRKLNIAMSDQTRSMGSISTVPGYAKNGYKLYICLDNSGSCDSKDDFVTVTEDYIKIHNLDFVEVVGNEIRDLYTLQNGENKIKYYARDPSNNTGDIETFIFNASENATGPEIAYFEVDPGRVVEGKIYSNSRNPVFKVTFFSRPTIIRKDVYAEGAKQSFEIREPEWVDSEASLVIASSLGDNDEYAIVLDARSGNGLTMDEPFLLNFTIDTIPPQLINLLPEDGALIYSSSLVNIEATFNEKVILTSLDINSEQYANKTTTRDNVSHKADRVYVSDGTKLLTVVAEDYATNVGTGTSTFVLNAIKELDIQMVHPSWGVSPEYTFDIELSTDNDAQCNYYFSLTPPPNIVDSFYDVGPFPSTGLVSHRLDEFNKIANGDIEEYELFVRCDDGYWDPTYEVFPLAVDTTPPVIEQAEANPEMIVDLDLNTTLGVSADDRISCRYDTSSRGSYDQMRFEFDDPLKLSDFKIAKTKDVHINSSESRSYTYSVACMNRAELKSGVKMIDFSVDLEAGFDVDLSHIAGITNTTSVPIIVTTNRKAMCQWGFSDLANTFVEKYDDGFKTEHHGTASGLSIGANTLYFKCYDKSGRYSDLMTKRVISDNTPPSMVETNITTYHPDYINPKAVWPTSTINAKLLAEDVETPDNIQYSYKLVEQISGTVMVNWTAFDTDERIGITTLDNGSRFFLTGGTYTLVAKPRNKVGLVGAEQSDAVTIDPTLENLCQNTIYDNTSETDVDCGFSCPGCADGKRCMSDADCMSRYCNVTAGQLYGICASASCDDVLSNGNETDVDCGGGVCDTCDIGDSCRIDSDCITSNCLYGTCAETDSCRDNQLTLSNRETDIDCGGPICLGRCDKDMNCIEDEDCMTDLKCRDDVCLTCLDNDLDCDGILNDKDDDIDGDGLLNWEDPDDDNDGLCDTAISPLNDMGTCEGEDDDDDGDGVLDFEDVDPDNDLDNDGIENHLDDDMDGDGIPNSIDDDNDNDGIPNDVDNDDDNDGILDRYEDDDGDGLSNEWELDHGLDPNDPDSDDNGILDGDEDWDDDGLNNSQEEEWGTDPNIADTDGDGWEDGKEVDSGTDPLDPESVPKSYTWIYILIMILILSLVGSGYYGYMQYPDEVNRFMDDTTDRVKIFAKKYGIDLGEPKRPRVPGRTGIRSGIPRTPAARVPSRQDLLQRRKKEIEARLAEENKKKDEFTKTERKKKIVGERPDKISKLKDIIQPVEKKATEDWITLGEDKGKPHRKRKGAVDRLGSLGKSKPKSVKTSTKLSKKKAPKKTIETKVSRRPNEEVFKKLGKLSGIKASDDALDSMRKLAKSKKLSKDEIFKHLDTLSKDKGVKKEHMDKIVSHVIDNKKASKEMVDDALSSISGNKNAKKKNIRKILSKVKK